MEVEPALGEEHVGNGKEEQFENEPNDAHDGEADCARTGGFCELLPVGLLALLDEFDAFSDVVLNEIFNSFDVVHL